MNPLLRIRHWAIFISFGDSRQNLYTTTTPCVKAEVYSNSAANNDFWHKQISQWKKLKEVYVINPNRSVNENGWNSEFSRATGSVAPTIATPCHLSQKSGFYFWTTTSLWNHSIQMYCSFVSYFQINVITWCLNLDHFSENLRTGGWFSLAG